MIRRFSIFLVGVLFGVMIIRFAFPGRFSEYARYFSLDYRVLYHLKKDTVHISPRAQCLLDCFSINQHNILDVLDGGVVNFGKSDKNATLCKRYVVEKDSLSVDFELCEQKVVIRDFTFNNKSCHCNY
ncbi:MAG: hypothetical protein VX344_06545 [Bacteroidota bacterium]|nr:hypothetical protein [Bacteroidota bacterium]